VAIDLSGSGFNHPVTHSQALANFAALAAGLLGLGRSRRYGAKRMLVQTHGVKHVGYFHQDQFPFVVTSGNSFSLNNANTLPG
jgi:hypothetical protein